MDANSDTSATFRVLPLRSEFNEEDYLYLHPDIALGVSSGAIESGWRHFTDHGFAEARQWNSKPDSLAGVAREISPGDEMFTGNEIHYFDVGESALHCVETALAAARRSKPTIRKLLDLPCGHGRVMRFLRKAFQHAELTACDLNRDGVEYCAKTFGAVPMRSRKEIGAIELSGDFDLIWCGSLLTHFPEAKCREFLTLFQRVLRPGGLVVFTLHGRGCAEGIVTRRNRHSMDDSRLDTLLSSYRQTGFGYVDYALQTGYGFSLAHPSFVLKDFIGQDEWRLISYHESAWDKLQDVICVQKSLGTGKVKRP